MGTVGREHGYRLESEVGKSLERFSNLLGEDETGNPLFFYIKTPDTKMFSFGLYCNNCHRKVAHNLIIPKSVSDYICAMPKSITWFIECKSSEQKSFPVANIEEHQLSFAQILESLSVPYWFFIQWKNKEAKERRLFTISGTWLIELIHEVEKNMNRKSIPWDMLEKRSIELQWLGYGLWDLSDVFGTPDEILQKAGITRKIEQKEKGLVK